MPDIDKLDEIFNQIDSNNSKDKESKTLISSIRKSKENRAISDDKAIKKYEKKTGCLGGFMYFLFVCCISLIIAFFVWMAVSDMLALNKNKFEVTLTLPQSAFTTVENSVHDDHGDIISTESYTIADIDYITDLLYDNGLISNKWLFKFYCNLSHAEKKFDPGEYTLKSTYDYRALVQNMRESSSGIGTVDVLIPEGFTMYQIFKRFDEEGVASYEDLVEAAKNSNFKYSFLDESMIGDDKRLEGYLFPDTYQFYVGMEASSAINKLLQTFNYKINADMLKQCDNLGYSLKEVIIVASIIEKEAGEDSERAFVASVIYNRLKSDWQLGMDSTILYLYPDYTDDPTAEMIAEDTPYNTRLHRGLPPTPICNPGLSSIQAALNPEQTGYYYFAADNDKKLHFFSNSNEFNQFVESLNE